MTTARDIVSGALGRLGVSSIGEDVSAEDAGRALAVFNRMMQGYAAKNADATWTDAGLSDTIASPASLDEPLVFLLSARLAPDYGLPVPTMNGGADIRRAERIVLANYWTRTAVEMPEGLQEMPSQYLGSYSRFRF